MKIETFPMFAARCEECGAEGPKRYLTVTAQQAARDSGWAEEKGVTRCPECRKKVKP